MTVWLMVFVDQMIFFHISIFSEVALETDVALLNIRCFNDGQRQDFLVST